MSKTILATMAPAQLLAIRAKAGVTYKVGDVLDFHHDACEINMQADPVKGEIPLIRVTELTSNGRPFKGLFTCQNAECEAEVEVHAGDFFQKRRCTRCQKRARRLASKGIHSEEEAEARKAERAAKAEETKAAKAEKHAKDVIARAEKARQDAEARLAKIRESAEKRIEKIGEVAREMGVPVSTSVKA